jgi:hypothetical protein
MNWGFWTDRSSVIARVAKRTIRPSGFPAGQLVRADQGRLGIYIGSEFRIDVSSEAGSRFDPNVTGFPVRVPRRLRPRTPEPRQRAARARGRAEEEFGFNATPYLATGKFVKVLGP